MVPSYVQHVLDRFEGVSNSGDQQWTARCTAHSDTNPSANITVAEDEKVLIHCFAGCKIEDILEKAGLRMSDLFPPSECSLAAYCAEKKLALETVKSYGVKEVRRKGVHLQIPYYSEKSETVAVRIRNALTGPNRFSWQRDPKISLYGLWQLNKFDKRNGIILVEGESDCHTLWSHGLSALGIPGASQWKEERDAKFFSEFDTIYVVVEPDAGGRTIIERFANSSVRGKIKLVTLGTFKDVSELHCDDPDAFLDRWSKFVGGAASWEARSRVNSLAARQQTEPQCDSIASRPNILDYFVSEVHKAGIVGEDRLIKILYLALVSRLFERPVSVVIKGPSSAGKSYVPNKVLEFFPSSAYLALSGMSERALVYSDESLENRFLVIYELAALTSDFQTYTLRTLMSESHLAYSTTCPSGDEFKAKTIVKNGPTGLIITTTSFSLHAENETRMLSVPIDESLEQTRRVIRSIASGNRGGIVDVKPWHAFQEWLRLGPLNVNSEFLAEIAEKASATALRMRRDFSTLKSLVCASALVHQRNRLRSPDGAIIATEADYELVRELVSDLFSEGHESTVSETVRRTVLAVKAISVRGEPVSLPELKNYLQCDRSTASRRVLRAIDGGFLRNLEHRPGHGAKVVVDQPLPDDEVVIPTLESIRKSMHSSSGKPRNTATVRVKHGGVASKSRGRSVSLSIDELKGVANFSAINRMWMATTKINPSEN